MFKFINIYEHNREHKGTTNKMINANDKANQSRAQELELKNIITKYGILPNEYRKTIDEPIYLDMRGEELTINERMQQKVYIDNYFNNMPAPIRDAYNHDKEQFYHELIQGKHSKAIQNGIITEEHSQQYINSLNKKQNTINELTATVNNLQQQLKNINVQNTQQGVLNNEQI